MDALSNADALPDAGQHDIDALPDDTTSVTPVTPPASDEEQEETEGRNYADVNLNK